MEQMGLTQATLIFIVANVFLSIIGFTNDRFVRWGLLTTEGVLKRQEWHRVLVSGFLHADPMHLFVNMLTLFFFGPLMEFVLGPQTFFLVYLGSLLAGSALALVMNAKNMDYAALGASGAVSGVLFSFCLYAPFEMIYFFGIIPIPAILFAVLYVAYSVYGMGARRDNIGHDAHLGGAIGGVLLTILLKPEIVPHFLNEISGLFG
ncbi:rhomboid family intramembrane serine protease [Ponticaulis profundi]|uniref:Rhomboid family intramembrane serine protease n=1 Tax=Ponticaulis profundi TaxID=2665222 RepID=A0ABW1SCH8_9PROT